jgi:hypothetical protein
LQRASSVEYATRAITKDTANENRQEATEAGLCSWQRFARRIMLERGCLGTESVMRIERRSPIPAIIQAILGSRLFHDAIYSGWLGVSLCRMAQVLAGIEAEPQSVLTKMAA